MSRPLVTHQIGSEIIDQAFEKKFDVIHSRNAIDHTVDPIAAINSCLNLCDFDEGGFVIIRVMPNEGEHAGYERLHQWNYFLESKDVFCADRIGNRFSISRTFNTFSFQCGLNEVGQEDYPEELFFRFSL